MKITVTRNDRIARWVVSYLMPTQTPHRYQRRRFSFTTESAANLEAVRLRKQYAAEGATGLRFDSVLYRRYCLLEQLLGAHGTVEQAVEHFLKNPPAKPSKPLEDVVGDFLDDKEGHVTKPWHRTLVRYLLRFIRAHPAARIDEVTPEQVKRFLAAQGGAETQANVRRMLHDLFNWATVTGRGRTNPVALVRVPKIIRPTPATLTVKNAEKLLLHSWEHEPKLIPYIALRLFAGMRSSLVLRLRWEMIDFGKGIRIPGAIDKGDRSSFRVNWPEALWPWLAPFQVPAGRVAKSNYPAEVCNMAIDLGFNIPRVSFRHTFGSSMLNTSGDIGRTQLLMGHRGSPAVLLEHYDGNVSGKEATALFELRPPTSCPRLPSASEASAWARARFEKLRLPASLSSGTG